MERNPGRMFAQATSFSATKVLASLAATSASGVVTNTTTNSPGWAASSGVEVMSRMLARTRNDAERPRAVHFLATMSVALGRLVQDHARPQPEPSQRLPAGIRWVGFRDGYAPQPYLRRSCGRGSKGPIGRAAGRGRGE